MTKKTINAWGLLRKSTNTLVLEGGISKNKKDIEPNKIYKDEYKAVKINIIY